MWNILFFELSELVNLPGFLLPIMLDKTLYCNIYVKPFQRLLCDIFPGLDSLVSPEWTGNIKPSLKNCHLEWRHFRQFDAQYLWAFYCFFLGTKFCCLHHFYYRLLGLAWSLAWTFWHFDGVAQRKSRICRPRWVNILKDIQYKYNTSK